MAINYSKTPGKSSDMGGLPPQTIYHYCNMDAARSILSSGVLWMTLVDFLNDKKEVRHFLSATHKAVVKCRHRWDGNIALKMFCRKLAKVAMPKSFVASFSTSRDRLSQWRAYGADGYGVALGFANSGPEQFDDGPFMFRSGGVTYGMQGVDRFAALVIETLEGRFIQANGTVLDIDGLLRHDHDAQALSDDVEEAAIFHKHGGFREEREWRWRLRCDFARFGANDGIYNEEPNSDMAERHLQNVAVTLSNDFFNRIKFRRRDRDYVSYVEFDFRKRGFKIVEIIIGPRANYRTIRSLFESALASQGVAGKVLPSKIPYRSTGESLLWRNILRLATFLFNGCDLHYDIICVYCRFRCG